jgi:hypothetical protein
MGDEFGINISGIRETIAALDRLPKQIVAESFDGALRMAGDTIQEAVATRTPHRVRVVMHSGERAGSSAEIRLPALIREITAAVFIDGDARGGSVEVGFGELGFIANFVEYGHHMVTHYERAEESFLATVMGKRRWHIKTGGGKDVGFVVAHPFMRPALDACAEEAIDVFAASLRKSAFFNEV